MAQPATTGSATAPTRGRMEFERAVGKLTKIDGKSLTVAMTENGTTKDVVVTCTDATRIIKSIRPANAAAAPVRGGRGPGTPAKFEDLKVGQEVFAAYSASDNTARMIRITAEAAPESGGGEATTTK